MIQCETSNYAIAKKYWTKILSLQNRRGYDRILIDKDITNSMPMHDVVLLVSELATSGCRDVKFAIYDRNYDAERCAFEEMASTNRGMKLRVCGTMAEAENWLTAEAVPVAIMTACPQTRAAA